ncbi:MAG: ribosome recycling factor [Candidatus Peribacteraceae bacterium]|nr:ribosome recycling factor [Candidatus Peribacteraceae bacterium]
MSISELLALADEQLAKAVERLNSELAGLQIGRASASLVENLQVEIYGAPQPIRNIANISVPDPKTIFIEPWDKSNLAALEKGIRDSSLGLNPNNDGARIILNIPPLTEERRKELTKLVGEFAENAKISVRRVREDLRKKAKSAKAAEEIGEDEEKLFDKKLQEKVDASNDQVETAAEKKEGEMMKV